MISLAAYRYRNALVTEGGPIEFIEIGPFPVRGRKMALANARLKPGLARRSTPMALFSDADGTGMDPVLAVARHKAISEAMERWAFHATAHSDRAEEFGFHVDPSTSGMSAFPGVRARSARHSAVLEAVERFSLISWWEGMVPGRTFQTDWPGVSAVAIDGPFGGITVVAYAATAWGGYVYGHAADESFGKACERAVMELARHEWVLRSRWLKTLAGDRMIATNVFERRCLFFATGEGHALFQERVAASPHRDRAPATVICDREIDGPWSEFATVWRFSLRPPTDGYRSNNEKYFFL